MKYSDVWEGRFLERPNRFIAYVELNNEIEKVHVKNTGRCKELLTDHARVYLEKGDRLNRSTKYDLIAVEKNGRIINMDSQAPNKAVHEWLLNGGLYKDICFVKPEYTYGASRLDFYAETTSGKRIFIEVKGVTFENDNIVMFPDAPSDRAVKHVRELIKAQQEGYEVYILFVIQMRDVRYLMPNWETHYEFGQALLEARTAGVHIIAYDCDVTKDEMTIAQSVPVNLWNLDLIEEPLLRWYKINRRILPWREEPTPYHVWLSEIMLQQTRVEAVKHYYARFLSALPDIESLAKAEEEPLLKLWEGLGYYNRVRNLQKAARVIIEEYNGELPDEYEELCKLPGIGSYTAGAIASIAYGKKAPAVDGNVLRVVSRIVEDGRDILDAKVKKDIETQILYAMKSGDNGSFNQAMMELGALVCVPNGEPLCENCPLNNLCMAHLHKEELKYPYKKSKKARSVEHKTVLILQDKDLIALQKRPSDGLLAGMYEFPVMEGTRTANEVIVYLKKMGFDAIKITKLEQSKHIFTHKEWHMTGYEIRMDELSRYMDIASENGIEFVEKTEIEEHYPIPSAYAKYAKYLNIAQGYEKATSES